MRLPIPARQALRQAAHQFGTAKKRWLFLFSKLLIPRCRIKQHGTMSAPDESQALVTSGADQPTVEAAPEAVVDDAVARFARRRQRQAVEAGPQDVAAVEQPLGSRKVPTPPTVEIVPADEGAVPLLRDETAAGDGDEDDGGNDPFASAFDELPLVAFPSWLRACHDLETLSDGPDPSVEGLPVSAAIALQIASDAAAARQWTESTFDPLASTVRVSEARQYLDAEQRHRHLAGRLFWQAPGAFAARMSSTHEHLTQTAAILQQAPPIGHAIREGWDGTQASLLPRAVARIRTAALHRSIMQDMFADPEANVTADSATAATLTDAFLSIPRVHSDFLQSRSWDGRPDDTMLLHEGASTKAALASNSTAGSPNQLQRVVSIHVSGVRFMSHPGFTREHYCAATLLEAFTRYRLFAANMQPGARNRFYYEAALRSSEQSAGVSRLESASTFAAEFTRLSHELQQATEYEASLIVTMCRAWYELLAYRRDPSPPSDPRYTAAPLVQFSLRPREQAAGDANFLPSATDFFDSIVRGGAASAVPADVAVQYIPDVYCTTSDPSYEGTLPLCSANAARRGPEATAAARYFVRIFVRLTAVSPLQKVGETAPAPLDSTFAAEFHESFEMRLHTEPVAIVLHVVELPSQQTLSVVQLQPSMSHAFAGMARFTTSTSYPSSTSGATPPPGAAAANAAGPGGASGQVASREIEGHVILSTSWITTTGLTVEAIQQKFVSGEADPMDPRNQPLLEVLRKHLGTASTAGKTITNTDIVAAPAASFHTASGDALLHPVSYDLCEADDRLKVLRRRWALVNKTAHPDDDFEEYLALPDCICPAESATIKLWRIEVEKRLATRDPNATKKGAGLQEWQQRIRKLSRAKGAKKLSDAEKLARTVVLPVVPTLGKFIAGIVKWLNPVSRLNPVRKDPLESDDVDRSKLRTMKQQETLSSSEAPAHAPGGRDESRLTLHIMKAVNVPMRDDGTPPNCYVEFSFIGTNARTFAIPSTQPTWFEALTVPFCPSDFDDETLALIDDDCIVRLYDEVKVPLPSASSAVADSDALAAHSPITHFRTERRLLGSLRLPFYSLYQSPTASIEGRFNILQSRSLMSYKQTPEPPSLTLFLSLWPAIRAKEDPITSADDLQAWVKTVPVSRELELVHRRALAWRSQLYGMLDDIQRINPLSKRREFEPFVNNSASSAVLISRYIDPEGVPPPPGVVTVAQCVGFVSLFPFVVDMLAWSDESDVWSTLPEFLEAGAGDYEELALLLVHLLRHTASAQPSYVVVGRGEIYSQATYVLVMINGRWCLIDPRCGNVFGVEDPASGLSEISMVVSHNQVWANVQLTGNPHRMVWNLDDERYWVPLVQIGQAASMNAVKSVQRTSIRWTLPSTDRAARIEDDVRRRVRALLRDLRGGRPLAFQERVGTLLREVLIQMEEERMNCANMRTLETDEAHQRCVGEFSSEYQAIGQPVQQGFKDQHFASLLDAVTDTSVHEIVADNLKFAVGVFVKAYTENVLSIWVYAVGLIRKP